MEKSIKKLSIKEVKEAYEEWQAAKNFFENVHDPELVDVAIYGAEAARRRYLYMLKLIRIYEEEEKLSDLKQKLLEKNENITDVNSAKNIPDQRLLKE